MISPSPRPQGISRRRLLGTAAVGGAIAWTTPVIFSSPAGAQGSCINTGVAWSDWEAAVNDLESSSFLVDPIDLSTTSMDVSYSPAGLGSGTASVGYVLISPLGAETSSFITVELDASAANEYVELTFLFSAAVDLLSFSLLDVDLGTGAWQDEVTLTATLAGSPVVLGVSDYTFNAAYVQHDDVFAGPKVADRFTGLQEAANNTTDANVAITYPAPLDTLVLRYLALGEAVDPELQQIGITNFSLCAF